ncbi:MAG: potassium-transporting ATPase subunit KdpA [Halobacteriota archaeon]
MDVTSIVAVVVIIVIQILLIRPTGRYILLAYFKERSRLDSFFGYIERPIFRLLGVNPNEGMNAKRYLSNLLLTNAFMWVVVFFILLYQGSLPLNPNHVPGMSLDLAVNTASSFVTNTDWQFYAGETQASYLSQLVLTFLMFTSAATGMAIGVAVIRGFASKEPREGFRKIENAGNFYFDFVRSVTRILVPLAFIVSLFFVAQGIPQTLNGPVQYTTIENQSSTLYLGPVSSMESIKMIGSNGGGFFGQNSANPYENPTPLTNAVEILAMLLIASGFVYAYGVIVGNIKEGWVLIAALLVILSAALVINIISELSNPALSSLAVNQSAGNMEGKEVRFGDISSAQFGTWTTAGAVGAVSGMHDSWGPWGGTSLQALMILNNVFGGLGCGMINILIFVILTVFISGLMVGRTPQYLGRKIEGYEVKLTVFAFLIHPLLVFSGTSLGVIFASGQTLNQGFQGFSELAYGYLSAAANNGSAFAGLSVSPFLNYSMAVVFIIGRYGTFILMLFVSQAFMRKRIVPYDLGTFKTDTWVFGAIFIGVVVILSLLTFFPLLIFGSLGEALASI